MDKRIEKRINKLIKDGEIWKTQAISGTDEPIVDPVSYGWLTSSAFLVNQLVYSDSIYSEQIRRLVDNKYLSSWVPYSCICKMLGILIELKKDYKHGLLSKIEYFYAAANFDAFLEHAKEYSQKGLKNEAGVLVSAVFEDVFKKITEKNNLDTPKNKEDIINELVKQGVFTQPFGRTVKAAVDLRNRALHAKWEEFSKEDVKNSIETVGALIEGYL